MPVQGASGQATGGPSPFAYALIRVVPRVERGECLNAGVVLFCRPRRFLAARIALDRRRLAALAPSDDVNTAAIQRQLDLIPLICAGDAVAGPIARLSQAERFGWLVAPSSTVVQPSPVHTGLSSDPAAELDRLFATMVAWPPDREATGVRR